MYRNEESLERRLRSAAQDGRLVQAAKSRSERNFGPSIPPSFKRFIGTLTMDKLLLGLLKLFHAQFRHISLSVALDKARRQHLEGIKPQLLESTIADLKAEEMKHQLELGPIYSSVVLTCGNYQNAVKDKQFFEAFLKFTTDVLCEAFNPTRWRDKLELHISEVFRTGWFNTVRRKQLPGPNLDTMKLKELYKFKHESEEGSDGKPAALQRHNFRVNVQKASMGKTFLVDSVIRGVPSAKENMAQKRQPQTAQDGSTQAGARPRLQQHQRQTALRGSPQEEARQKLQQFAAQPAMSPLPVHVLPNGMVSDDSIRELDLLQSALAAAAIGPVECQSQRSLFVSSSFTQKLPIAATVA